MEKRTDYHLTCDQIVNDERVICRLMLMHVAIITSKEVSLLRCLRYRETAFERYNEV